MAVKGQATLDAAKARKAAEPKKGTRQSAASQASTEAAAKDNALVTLTHTAESGYTKPKTLRQLEHIVADNALRGAGLWRKAADALLFIRDQKLWRKATDDKGEPYANFAEYAELRFGFKKTYAYDLVKAASRKPDALTEGSARAEMAAERAVKPLTRQQVLEKMQKAFDLFEDKVGDLRDRSIDDTDFVHAYDVMMGVVGDSFRLFIDQHAVIAGEAIPSDDGSMTEEDVAALEREAAGDADEADNAQDDDDDRQAEEAADDADSEATPADL